MKNLGQDNRSPSRHFKTDPPNYESGVLNIRPQRAVSKGGVAA
jgi:hypothetical protein